MYYEKKRINTDNTVMNKTRLYLVQQLQHYGNEFVEHIAKSNIVCFAIQDYGINTTEDLRKIESSVYILFDVNGNKSFGNYENIHKGRYTFHETLKYYQNHSSYVTDYCYDSNKTGHLHVIVVKLPFPEKMDLFLKGQYSKLYSEEELSKWFIKHIDQVEIIKGKKIKTQIITDQYKVLTHDESYFPTFKEKILAEFGTKLNDGDVIMEYDFKPTNYKEILRYEL